MSINTHIGHYNTHKPHLCTYAHLKDMFHAKGEVRGTLCVVPGPSGRPRHASQCGTAWAEVPGLCVPCYINAKPLHVQKRMMCLAGQGGAGLTHPPTPFIHPSIHPSIHTSTSAFPWCVSLNFPFSRHLPPAHL